MPTGGRYRSLSGALVEAEKRRDSYESEDDVPDLVMAEQGLLGQPSKTSFAYHLPRRRFSRYFTLAITTIIGLFILYLVQSSWTEQAELKLGLKKPPPPPPAWEQFPFLTRYHGGIRTLVDRAQNKPEYPYSAEEAELKALQDAAMAQKKQEDDVKADDGGFQKRQEEASEFVKRRTRFEVKQRFPSDVYEPVVKCYLDNKTKVEVPSLLAYQGVTEGFPDPAMGSHKLLGIRNDVCFERHGRLAPYGFGYSRKYGGSGAGDEGEKEGAEEVWGEQLEIDYRTISWAKAQEDCAAANAHRFKPPPKQLNHFFTSMGIGGPEKELPSKSISEGKEGPHGKKLVPRTAIIIRTWWDYNYDAEDMLYLRALVNELALHSGTEYVVHFLVHVKDDNKQIWADEETYNRVLANSLPEEFRGMGTLWSERQMGLIYGGVAESFYRDLPVHGAYRSTYLPVQYFAHMHPEYDFFWHWEMDIRYTGHFYHLFSQISEWAKQQPRKGLWERNGRFYVPSEHGSWEDFRQMVRVQTEHGTAQKSSIYNKLSQDAGSKHPLDEESRRPEKPVWGPLGPTGQGDTTADPDNDPIPPTTYDRDNYEWGVGEEADFITFNPLFDPHNTNWILAEDVTGYNTSAGFPPRRTAIITASRLSRRLLETMHRETALARHTMFSEMWPGSCALHHGYKAVYAPHPVYIDRAWPTSYLTAIFNNGLNGAAGGSRTSVFSDERQHNFRGTTWYYDAGFSPNLWKRWLGYKVDNDGGEQEEKAGEGRMCLPAMLLHPVKQVDLVYEHQVGE
ncbi:hypothetical protein LTR78_008229 [Recurvomyces mirabilis]|uniref:Uncharacterized protein n=1 Tax=Recurvomyces mirabilis TaxID=574656 RepID=A0AAE0WFT2_9PEZI|nr:hypothetical protein LTR78_008229 [Recurvomyces mirabilis]KAK5156514.1 hypothetical protein LTS14_004726 [Recurvomyces mirabilis]